jgi:ribonuclease P protein component
MRKEQRLTRSAQYHSVRRRGDSWADRYFVLQAQSNGLEVTRFGLTVSKRVGGAVTRNRVKRLLRENLTKLPVKPGRDLVIIARPIASGVDYKGVETSLRGLIGRARLLENETTSGAAD